MAVSAKLAAKLAALERVAELQGENLAREGFGELGPDLDTSLADLEGAVRPLVAALARGFLGKAAEKQAVRVKTAACPKCGHECEHGSQPRRMVGEQGPFSWDEPVIHCSECEQSFFPSAGDSED